MEVRGQEYVLFAVWDNIKNNLSSRNPRLYLNVWPHFFLLFSDVPFATEGKEVIGFTNLALGCAVKAICQSESVKLTLGSRYLRLAAVGFDILYYT